MTENERLARAEDEDFRAEQGELGEYAREIFARAWADVHDAAKVPTEEKLRKSV